MVTSLVVYLTPFTSVKILQLLRCNLHPFKSSCCLENSLCKLDRISPDCSEVRAVSQQRQRELQKEQQGTGKPLCRHLNVQVAFTGGGRNFWNRCMKIRHK